jgi:hypothetical protein
VILLPGACASAPATSQHWNPPSGVSKDAVRTSFCGTAKSSGSGEDEFVRPPTCKDAWSFRTTGLNILIVAIDHALQLAKDPSDPSRLATQKDQLKTILSRQIQERKVRFISEESDPEKTTIARRLANATQPPIPWKNIQMSDEERTAAGVKEALQKRPGHPDYETMAVWIESRIPEDIVREDFLLNRHSTPQMQLKVF